MLDITDVIIEAMPFADQLIEWCHKHPEFKDALKFSNPDNFLALGAVLTSSTQNVPDDEVIGYLAYDMKLKYFKQDFIINIGGRHETFMLYTKLPNKRYGSYVQHINQFYARYGKNGAYADTHHLSLEDLDAIGKPDLSERARSTIALAKRIGANGKHEPSQDELHDVLRKIREARQESKLVV